MQTAAILAGGRARRLGGRDKSRLVIGGRTILERQLDVLRLLGCDRAQGFLFGPPVAAEQFGAGASARRDPTPAS